MRILIYKRTHSGDPNAGGWFGNEDCMGPVRQWKFDAVIGVGGIGPEARFHGIDGKVNWIGIGAHKDEIYRRGPLVRFDHFLCLEQDGPSFQELAPNLARRMYGTNARRISKGLTPTEKTEAEKILRLAANAPPSAKRLPSRSQLQTCGPCKPKCRPRPRC